MKILFLFPHFLLPGGAANAMTKFASGLQKKGHLVEIICANATPEFLANNSDLKIVQLRIPSSNSFFYWALFPCWQIKINKVLEKYPDYIFFPQVLPSNWWAWMYKLSHKNQKIVWYCNEPSAFIHSKKWIDAIPSYPMRIGAKLLRPILKKIDTTLEKQNDLVICNSHFTANEYERCYAQKAADVVYPPIDILPVELEKNKEKYFFTVSRLSKFKNVDILIEAFAEFSVSHTDYKLIIAGDGEDREHLQKMVHDKKLDNRIVFPGKISDEEREVFYEKALATVLCSHFEPFGIVPIESMMHGTPVIAHRSGGPMETVRDGESGYLFSDEKDLVECLKKIVGLDSAQYLPMQEACQREAKKYDATNLTLELENILLTKL